MNKTSNVRLTYQSYGSSCLVFIQADSAKATYEKWLHMANWGATSLLNGEEPKFVTEGVISCWSTIERLQKYLFDTHLDKLAATVAEQFKGKPDGFKNEALRLAELDFAAIGHETYRSVGSSFEEHSMGTIEAAKPDSDFKDECYKFAFAN